MTLVHICYSMSNGKWTSPVDLECQFWVGRVVGSVLWLLDFILTMVRRFVKLGLGVDFVKTTSFRKEDIAIELEISNLV